MFRVLLTYVGIDQIFRHSLHCVCVKLFAHGTLPQAQALVGFLEQKMDRFVAKLNFNEPCFFLLNEQFTPCHLKSGFCSCFRLALVVKVLSSNSVKICLLNVWIDMCVSLNVDTIIRL